MADLTFLYPGVPGSMHLLKQKGMVLRIVSTKFRYRIEMILRREHLEDAFAVIIGAKDVSRTKPDPEGLTLAQQRAEVAFHSSLYVGDSVIDAETAHKGGTPFAAVLSGMTPRDAFDVHAPLKIAENLDQLVCWLLD